MEESLNGIRQTGIPVLRDMIDSNREPVYEIFENRRAGEAINFAGVIINLVSGVDRTIVYQRELWSNMQKG